MRIGEKLRIVRKAHGYTLEQLAAGVGVHPVSVGQYERGTRPTPWEFIERVATFFDIDPQQFSAEQPWRLVEDAEAQLTAAVGEAQRILSDQRRARVPNPPRGALRSGKASALRSDPEANAARGDEVRGPLRSGLFARQAGQVAVPA